MRADRTPPSDAQGEPVVESDAVSGVVSRRSFIGVGASAVAAATLSVAPGAVDAKPRHRRGRGHGAGPVTEVESGRVRGRKTRDVVAFLGIPYAAAPVGDLRFTSPRPAPGWRGVREALHPGPSSIQTNVQPAAWIFDTSSMLPFSEDCLYLNVWTPSTRGRRPVIVYIHGGGGRFGSGTVLGIDGSELAPLGDVVVVTLNYRLGALGLLAHPELEDPATGLSANWGLQDLVHGLRWVRRNIAAFGGDPRNVTLSGESWGGMIARDISQNPAWHGLFDKLIASSIRLPVVQSPTQAARYTELLASRLNTSVAGLKSLPADTLHQAEFALSADAAARATIGNAALGQVVDGETILHPTPYVGTSSAVPLLVGTNRNESFIDYNLWDPATGQRVNPLTAPTDEAGLRSGIEASLASNYPAGKAAPSPEAVVERYRASMARRGEPTGPADVFMEFQTDIQRRGESARWAAEQVECRRAAAYVYEFAQPLIPPGTGTPHTIDIPFTFGAVEHPFFAARVGRSRIVSAVSEALMKTWARFAHKGDPSSSATGRWRTYRTDRREVATLGGRRIWRIDTAPRDDQLAIMPAFHDRSC